VSRISYQPGATIIDTVTDHLNGCP